MLPWDWKLLVVISLLDADLASSCVGGDQGEAQKQGMAQADLAGVGLCWVFINESAWPGLVCCFVPMDWAKSDLPYVAVMYDAALRGRPACVVVVCPSVRCSASASRFSGTGLPRQSGVQLDASAPTGYCLLLRLIIPDDWISSGSIDTKGWHW